MPQLSKEFYDLRRETVETLLLRDVVGFSEEGYEWTIHREDRLAGRPVRPRSPFFISLRPPAEEPGDKPGNLLDQDYWDMARLMEIYVRQMGINFKKIGPIPKAGNRLVKHFARICKIPPSDIIAFRKETDGDDKSFWVEGDNFEEGDDVLLFDDLLNHNKTKRKALEGLARAGLKAAGIIVFLDGELGGSDELRAEGCEVHSILTTNQFICYGALKGHFSDADCARAQKFMNQERVRSVLQGMDRYRLGEIQSLIENSTTACGSGAAAQSREVLFSPEGARRREALMKA